MLKRWILPATVLVAFSLPSSWAQAPPGRCPCPAPAMAQPYRYTAGYGVPGTVTAREFVFDPYNVGYYPGTFTYGTYSTYRVPHGGPFSYPTANWFYTW